MKSDSSFDFWPGYVAAISCLVLGLLLVASVVASLTTQLGLLAGDYNAALLAQALRRAAARAEAQAEVPAQRTPAPRADSLPAPAPIPAAPEPVAPPVAAAPAGAPAPETQQAPKVDNFLTLIFGEQVAGIPSARRPEIVTALRQLSVASGSPWRVWALAPEGDLARRRSTFRLMVSVRTFLAEQGIPERIVELRLLDGPITGNPGDIVVWVGPTQADVADPAPSAGVRP